MAEAVSTPLDPSHDSTAEAARPTVVWPAVIAAGSGNGAPPRIVRAEVIYDRLPEPALPTEAAAPLPSTPSAAPIADNAIGAPPLPITGAPTVPNEASVVPMLPPSTLPMPAAATAAAIAVPTASTAAATTFELPVAEPLPPPPFRSTQPSWRRWARRTALAATGLFLGYVALVVVLIGAYRGIDPPMSALMLELRLRGEEVDYRPVPLTSISSYLQRAVITSEDARFCTHRGVDWGALAEAIQDSRGGSTITMQTAKNLFLWPSRSYIRKAIEIPIALTIDFAWPKRRVLEVYLNIAEWGPGIFGAEAAAQYHFNKSAARLTQHEAALLAASLPNPLARDAGEPGRIVALLATRLRARMTHSDAFVSCLGLRHLPRAAPTPAPRSSTPAPSKAAPRPAPWKTETTRTEPAKPDTPPFNPWQN